VVHKLETFTDQHHVRELIWWYHADLKAYRTEPTSRRRSEMRTRFDRIFQRQTGFVVSIRGRPRISWFVCGRLLVCVPMSWRGG